MLLLHPGENFEEGERYIVALGGLRTASGKRIKASKGFRALKRGAGPQRLRERYRGIFRTLRRAGVAKRKLHAGVGLHGRLRARADRAHAAHPRRRVRPARGPQPRRRPIEGSAPQFTVTNVVEQPRPADPAPHLRHLHRPVLPERGRVPARRDASTTRAARRTRCPPSGRATRRPRRSSARSRSPRRRPRAPRSTATGCSAARTRSTRTTSRTCPRSTTSRSARRRGAASPPRTSRTRSRSSATSPASRHSPTASSRASSTSSTSGGC